MEKSNTATLDKTALNTGQTFVWHELDTPNAKESIEFYTNAFGFGTEEVPMGDAGTYHMLTANGSGVCGVMDTNETPGMKGTPPHWAVYLAVDDVDARLAKCVELGAKTLVEPMDVPKAGRMCLIQDPQGAKIWLYKAVPMD